VSATDAIMFRRNFSQADVPVLSGSGLAGVIKALAITAICIAMPVDVDWGEVAPGTFWSCAPARYGG